MTRRDALWTAGAFLLAAAVLLAARLALSGPAEANRIAERQAMMETLLPGAATFLPVDYDGEDENITAVWSGETGYVVETVVDGYAGPIRMWTGVSSDGTVTGLVVRDMGETLGLGREALTDTGYLAELVGTDGTAEVGQDVDAITGATVTSRAIVRSVNSAAAYVTGADVSTSATEWGG